MAEVPQAQALEERAARLAKKAAAERARVARLTPAQRAARLAKRATDAAARRARETPTARAAARTAQQQSPAEREARLGRSAALRKAARSNMAEDAEDKSRKYDARPSNPEHAAVLGRHDPVKDGPFHKLDYVVNEMLQFEECMQSYDMQYCKVCEERWPSKSTNTDGTCERCRKAASRPIFSAENRMKMLVAMINPIVPIHFRKKGKIGFRGHVINLFQDVLTVRKTLPLLPAEVEAISYARTTDAGKNIHLKVRRAKVKEMLDWLFEHSPPYKLHAKYDKDRLAQLPADDVPVEFERKAAAEAEQDWDADDSDEEEVGPPQAEQPGGRVVADALRSLDTATAVLPGARGQDELEVEKIKRELGKSLAAGQVESSVTLPYPKINYESAVDEFNTEWLFTMTFPCLFGDGSADPSCQWRAHPVEYSDAARHLYRYAEERTDGSWSYRFAEDERFGFWMFNMMNRHSLKRQASYFLKTSPAEADMTVEELQSLVDSSSHMELANKIMRYSGNVRGSDAYWAARRQEVTALMRHCGMATCYFTLTAADFHWDDLWRILGKKDDLTGAEIARLMQRYHHIIDWYVSERMKVFVETTLVRCFDADWFWYRFEWQKRGAAHVHGFLRLRCDPDLGRLARSAIDGHVAQELLAKATAAADLDQAERSRCEETVKAGRAAEQEIIQFAEYFESGINPLDGDAAAFQFPEKHPCSTRYSAVEDEDEDYCELVNCVQRHTKCTSYCLRDVTLTSTKPESAGEKIKCKRCRFGAPKPLRPKTEITYTTEGTSDFGPLRIIRVELARNDPLCVHSFNRALLTGWRANCDFSIMLDPHLCLIYVVKCDSLSHSLASLYNRYASKGEPTSKVLGKALKEAFCKKEEARPALISAFMCIGKDHDWTRGEIAHLLLGLPLVSTNIQFEHVSLSNRKIDLSKIKAAQGGVADNDDNGGAAKHTVSRPSMVDSYMARKELHPGDDAVQQMSLEQYCWTFEKGGRRRLRRVVPVFHPSFPINVHSITYWKAAKFLVFQMKPFYKFSDLWMEEHGDIPEEDVPNEVWHEQLMPLLRDAPDSITRVVHEISAAKMKENPDDMGFIAEVRGGDYQGEQTEEMEAWMAASSIRGRANAALADKLAKLPHLEPGDLQHEYSAAQRAALPSLLASARQKHLAAVRAGQPGDLPPRRKVAYNELPTAEHRFALLKVMRVMAERRRDPSNRVPFELSIEGPAGSGKSVFIDALLAVYEGTAWVVTYQGVAAVGVQAETINSRFQISPSGFDLLSEDALAKFQLEMDAVDLIVFDEFAMTSQKLAGYVSKRIRQGSSAKWKKDPTNPFCGRDIIALYDFGQLPPVEPPPLYEPVRGKAADARALGYEMMARLCQNVVQFTVLLRQAEDEDFQRILTNMREGRADRKDWELLRARCAISSSREAPWDAVHLFGTNEERLKHNRECLERLGQPLAFVQPVHRSRGHETAKGTPKVLANGAKARPALIPTASLSQVMLTSNLWPQAGLANGSTGVVIDIVYEDGAVLPCLPAAVIVDFPTYCGPQLIGEEPERRHWVPVVPIRAQWFGKKGNAFKGALDIPLEVAFGFTGHKAQGITLDQACVVVPRNEFAANLTYVMLSRVRTLAGLYLSGITFERYAKCFGTLGFRKSHRFRRFLTQCAEEEKTADAELWALATTVLDAALLPKALPQRHATKVRVMPPVVAGLPQKRQRDGDPPPSPRKKQRLQYAESPVSPSLGPPLLEAAPTPPRVDRPLKRPRSPAADVPRLPPHPRLDIAALLRHFISTGSLAYQNNSCALDSTLILVAAAAVASPVILAAVTAAGPSRWQTDPADGLLSLLHYMLTTRGGLSTTSRDRIRTALSETTPESPEYRDGPGVRTNPSSYLRRHLIDDQLRSVSLKIASIACPCGRASVGEEIRTLSTISTRRDVASLSALVLSLLAPQPWPCPQCQRRCLRRIDVVHWPPLLVVEGEGAIRSGFSLDSFTLPTGERYQLVGRTEYLPGRIGHWRARLRVDGQDLLYDDLVQGGRLQTLRADTFADEPTRPWTLFESHVFYVKI